jgi:DNA (cytosine-5)-methyltransferase 1
MRYLSVCSGIESASVAWHSLGWTPVAFSEIEPFPCALLAHHYPDVPNWGDLTKFQEWPDAAIDLLVGGTPCQSFSVAGLRKGLADPRGNLALTYLAVADRYRPEWLVFENVPGLLSADGGKAFGSFLGALAELGYGFAYRVLDAQHVRTRDFKGAVPQRRRRLFVVAHLGDWRRAAAVLFDSESLRRDSPEDRPESTEDADDSESTAFGTWWDGSDTSQTLDAVLHKKQAMPEKNRFPAVLVPAWQPCEMCDEFICNIHHEHAFECDCPPIDEWVEHDIFPYANTVLRYITPTEAERLQGFPDGWTDVPYRGKPAADGPRYKALGNSMAVNVMRWIGERIQEVSNG